MYRYHTVPVIDRYGSRYQFSNPCREPWVQLFRSYNIFSNSCTLCWYSKQCHFSHTPIYHLWQQSRNPWMYVFATLLSSTAHPLWSHLLYNAVVILLKYTYLPHWHVLFHSSIIYLCLTFLGISSSFSPTSNKFHLSMI